MGKSSASSYPPSMGVSWVAGATLQSSCTVCVSARPCPSMALIIPRSAFWQSSSSKPRERSRSRVRHAIFSCSCRAATGTWVWGSWAADLTARIAGSSRCGRKYQRSSSETAERVRLAALHLVKLIRQSTLDRAGKQWLLEELVRKMKVLNRRRCTERLNRRR